MRRRSTLCGVPRLGYAHHDTCSILHYHLLPAHRRRFHLEIRKREGEHLCRTLINLRVETRCLIITPALSKRLRETQDPFTSKIMSSEIM